MSFGNKYNIKENREYIKNLITKDMFKRIEKILDIKSIIDLELDLNLSTSASKDWQMYYERVGYSKAMDDICKIIGG